MPGAQCVVTFGLTVRDLSFWHEESETWVATLEAVAHIGESFTDIRRELTLAIDIPKLWKSGWLGWRTIAGIVALCLVCGAIVWAVRSCMTSDGFSITEDDESSGTSSLKE